MVDLLLLPKNCIVESSCDFLVLRYVRERSQYHGIVEFVGGECSNGIDVGQSNKVDGMSRQVDVGKSPHLAERMKAVLSSSTACTMKITLKFLHVDCKHFLGSSSLISLDWVMCDEAMALALMTEEMSKEASEMQQDEDNETGKSVTCNLNRSKDFAHAAQLRSTTISPPSMLWHSGRR